MEGGGWGGGGDVGGLTRNIKVIQDMSFLSAPW